MEGILGYVTTQTFANIHGVKLITVQQWLLKGKLPGAVRFGRVWMIPATLPKPDDMRFRSHGKYKDWRKKYGKKD